jgi:hypothetical protein
VKIENGIPIDSDLPPPDADGRRAAEELSRDCPHCGGNGLAIVDARRADVRTKSCAATCVCVHGRWIRAWHLTKGHRHVTDRLPELRSVLAGRDGRWMYVNYDPESDQPAPDAPSRRQINALFRSPA